MLDIHSSYSCMSAHDQELILKPRKKKICCDLSCEDSQATFEQLGPGCFYSVQTWEFS